MYPTYFRLGVEWVAQCKTTLKWRAETGRINRQHAMVDWTRRQVLVSWDSINRQVLNLEFVHITSIIKTLSILFKPINDKLKSQLNNDLFQRLVLEHWHRNESNANVLNPAQSRPQYAFHSDCWCLITTKPPPSQTGAKLSTPTRWWNRLRAKSRQQQTSHMVHVSVAPTEPSQAGGKSDGATPWTNPYKDDSDIVDNS